MGKRFVYSFAFNGDTVSVPDSTQSSGSVSYQEGYNSKYELEVGVEPTARRIARGPYNQVLRDVTENLKEWQEQFAPDFITSANNGGVAFAYNLGMIVWGGAGYRRSTSGNNTSDVTDDNNWENYNFGSASQATETVAGVAEIATQTETGNSSDDLRFITPLKLATRLGQLGGAPWELRVASFLASTGQKYNVTSTTPGLGATLPATVTAGLPLIIHNNAQSTQNILIVNNGHTIHGFGATLTSADNIILPAGRALIFIGTAANTYEVF